MTTSNFEPTSNFQALPNIHSGALPVVVPTPTVPNENSTAAEHQETQAHRTLPEKSLEQIELLQRLIEAEANFDCPPLGFELPSEFLLSIVVPVFNERATISTVLSRLLKLPLPVEILVVDDHSTDGTVDVLRQFADLDNVRLLVKSENEGKGAALRSGFEMAKGDVCVVQDADLEYDPREILRLIEPIVSGEVDVVYGSRFLESHRTAGSSSLHQWGNQLLTRISNFTTGMELTDMETCYKVFRRNVLESIELKQDRFGFEPEFTAKIARRRFPIRELPISYHARDWDEGKKIGFRDGLNAIYCILRYALCD